MSKKYEYDYTICTEFDEDIFNRQCKALEQHIHGIKKGLFLHDVDNSKLQYYDIGGKELRVVNDFQIGAVYIDSDIELRQFF